MKIKKILLMLIIVLTLSGCVNVKEYSYDDIINTLSHKEKRANTFKNGYQFFVPKGLSIENAGTNYAILSSSDVNYYLYVDLVSYNENKKIAYVVNKNSVYSKGINYNGKSGYVEINLWKNNQYLIEIVYNYAKIEVMVEESLINKALINSISILNSIRYNDLIIENLLSDDNLTYTEEVFDIFETTKDNPNYLDYVESDTEVEIEEEIKDTDFIN